MSPIKYSDHDLELTHVGFSGAEWADGTAQEFYRQDYKLAVAMKEPRHTPFRERIFAFYQWRWNQECPWDGSEAKQLAALLKSSPSLDIQTFSRWLYNYGRSENIAPGERPRSFLPRIHNYSITHLNVYGRDPHVKAETFAERDAATTSTARARILADIRRTNANVNSDRKTIERGANASITPGPRSLPGGRD